MAKGGIKFYKDLSEPAMEQHRFWAVQSAEARLLHLSAMRAWHQKIHGVNRDDMVRKIRFKSVEGWL